MESFLFQATIYLGAAVIAVPFAARMGLGSVLGYLAAGIFIGPITGLVGTETQDLQHFAEFGVVMMLFLIGLELEPRVLWNMRDRLIGLGGLQITVTTTLIMGGAMAMGYAWNVAFAIGMIFALSSTAIVLQTLSEKGLMQTNGGRSTFSVLLTQDIAVIPMLAILPLLAITATATIAPDGSLVRTADHDDAHHAMSLVDGLPGWGVTLVTLGAVAAVILTGIFLTRPVFRYIHHARLREMYTALALLMVVSIAVLMSLVGLSPALGTFLAGVVLANSEFRHELESDLEPFKGLLLGLFFITVGAGIDFGLFFREPVFILSLTVGVMLIKGIVLYGLSVLFKIKGKDRWLFALGLAQAGEFGFILISFSGQQGVLSPGLSSQLLLIVALSMLITPLLFIIYEIASRRITDGHDMADDDVDEQGTVIIAGIGRFGQIVNRLVQSAGFSTVVIDNDLSTVQMMRTFGFKGYFGDPTRPDLLKAAGLDDARVLVVAIDDKKMANTLVTYARKTRPDLHIIARARDRVHAYELNAAGANDIVRELFDSSLRAGRYALENLGLSEFEANEAETFFYEHDRAAIRELSEFWKPGVALRDNAEYVARAKELNNDLETALAEKQQSGEETRDAKKRRGGR
ncbi:monovalent cation:proton antiporter-2 (CPA2) family protein [Loktanella sp. F6476L]|uniref:monovalent cation:proton antiporter-2 (CPA2) family protein n=1 Tax=Loktanella sp. F6476L TaxID=2926405 RepID=UPI001FF13C14|nr:monovalent cation:proton antiporter-2 (CPA2) family protein [Loktanella sp. F6476L]MCK0119322.1 monovalent cation:proton antiporter-2 (CPA2) family protein [Loktanella sp. F6476L]UWR00650.1 monovalent cation:proton antiporter-2 (CPA2) family protein [Rhodobacteraceae bacterium S2214]